RRRGLQVLVVEGQPADLDDLERERRRRERGERVRHLAVERFLAQAPDEHGDLVVHGVPRRCVNRLVLRHMAYMRIRRGFLTCARPSREEPRHSTRSTIPCPTPVLRLTS